MGPVKGFEIAFPQSDATAVIAKTRRNAPRALHRGRPTAAFVSTGATILAFTFLFGVALYPNLITSTLGPGLDITDWSVMSLCACLRNLLR